MTIGKLSSLGVIKFTWKYFRELCIGGFIAQEVDKNHSYSIYWMIDQKLWRKKTFSMRSVSLNSSVSPRTGDVLYTAVTVISKEHY